MTNRIMFPFACVAAWLGLAPALPAQGDPIREIQEIARAVDEQLQEIDRLLLESGKKSQPRQKPKELLQQAGERSQAVEDGIDTLIEKLQQMKNQGGGGSSSSDQQPDPNQQNQDQGQQGQQPKPQGQGQRNRNENKTPDIAPRPGEKPGGEQPGGEQPGGEKPQGQGQQPQPGEGTCPKPGGDGQPQGGEETKDGGKNTTGNRQIEPETGPGTAGSGEGSWGELQPYMNFLKNRGSPPPQVPEKFRKYYEAWLKQNPGAGGQGAGTKPGGSRR
jgi:hypothetical protein